MSRQSLGTWTVLVVGLAAALSVTPAFADSQVRIVRLSDVEGTVQVDKNTGQGFEKAFLNMPIVQGMKLATKDGRAEVEFEDGSTVRITPKSTVEFSELTLRDSGGRASTVVLKTGMAYVNYTAKGKADEFTVLFANEKIQAGQAVHFRRYAPEQIPYALARYTDEVNRLYGVMNTRLAKRKFLAGRYSIADIACVGWVRLAERQGQNLAQFPHLQRWFETIRARPAVKRAFAIRVEAASKVDVNDPKVRAVLFGQRAR